MEKAIYIRVSTEDQEPENQIKECKSLFEGEYQLYQDKQSAWKDDKEREDFERLRKDISSNKIKEIYCWDWDRLFRNRKKLKEFFKFCAIYKCNIHSFRQKFYEDLYKIPEPFNEIMQELILNFMGWLAEDESLKKSGRVKNAVVREEGKPTKSYKGNKWGRKSISKQAINKILELKSKGLSVRQISKEVTYAGKNNVVKNVSPSLVHKIITKYSSNLNEENFDKEDTINYRINKQ
jgi:DNA invertase Pin-like site-specific DNA recombinase